MSEIPVWNGDYKNLPLKGTVFLFNGTRYRWEDCPCCGRPEGISITTENIDVAMTIRLRGMNQGHAEFQLLLEMGCPTEKLASAVEEKGLIPALKDLTREIMNKDPIGKGVISFERFAELSLKLKSPSMMQVIADMIAEKITDSRSNNPGGILN